MARSNKFLFSILALVTILACNVAGGQDPTSAPDFVATITAQALLIQPTEIIQPSPAVIVVTATPELATQIPFTDTPIPTATITLTPSPSIPMLTVSADTNCRSGPSKAYDYLGALLIGKSAEVVGKNTSTGYWIIKNPERDGNCWLWGNYATVTGDTSKLQEFPIPATPTPSAAGAIKGLKANKLCFFDGFGYQLSGSITWQASSNTEQYWIFLNGNLHGGTFADQATIYAIPAINLAPGGSISMGVQAVSDTGNSPLREVTITCP
jgi:hypothetical protein